VILDEVFASGGKTPENGMDFLCFCVFLKERLMFCLSARKAQLAAHLLVLMLFAPFALSHSHGAKLAPKDLPREVHQVVYKAQEALNKKEYQNARKLLLEHMKKHPKRPHALVYAILGNAWYLEGHRQEAYEAYSKGYDLDSHFFSLCLNLAKVSYELKKYREAGPLFEKAYELAEKPPAELLYQAGVAYFQGEQYAEARRVLTGLLRDKSREPWMKLLIQTYLKLEQWQEAEEVLLTFLEQEPMSVQHWKLLAQVKLRRGDHRGAASALEIAYEMDPPDKSAWKELANLYFHLNIPHQGVRCLEKAYGSNPASEECDELAGRYAQASRPERAIHYLNLAIRQEPSVSRYLKKGELYYRRGLWREAIDALKMCLDLDPDNGLAQILLGFSAWELGDHSLAEQAFTRAANDEHYRSEALEALEAMEALRGQN
jgi:tetratricopeptide (TPR) repeat protein